MQKKKAIILEKIANGGVREIKREITKRRLINTGTLKRSVGADIKKNTVKFEIDSDYAGIINNGVRRHKMRYLVDKGAIPLKFGRPKRLQFRVANSKNINRRGAWTHPGFNRGKGFFDVATDNITKLSGEIIAQVGLR